MFTWNIAKSAESMFSRWAMKRFFKFALKKKLGQFILGEIDLDQLDVQLRAGTIQLFDLALNVDFLNQKLGQAGPVIIKEGSIGSLLVSMPWNGNGFEVEVDKLELLLTPCSEHRFRTNEETSTSDQDRVYVNQESIKLNCESGEYSMGEALDIHEGVKTVARMVKWFLTRFHVKVKRLIVAYDPYSDRDGSNSGMCPNLVLRVCEIDCGTRVSEDVDSESGSDAQNILGISRLTNFFTFKGAILELLLIDDFNKHSVSPGVVEGSVEQIREPNSSGVITPIITGEGGGFSGTMKLSIPWKDGSLNTSKVDSTVEIDPILLRIEPSTMKWIVTLWDSLQAIEKDHQQSANSVYYNASSQLFSSILGSTVNPTGKPSSVEESLFGGAKSSNGKEQGGSCLLPDSLIISNWVPSSVNESHNQADERYEGLDFGSSVEQFLECFDGLRSSQNALASSGILSWTCSVFNAITAASNLASGSYNAPPEQKHIEANVRMKIASISILFSLHDDDHYTSCGSKEDKTKDTGSCQYLLMDVQSLLLDYKASPHVTKLGVTMEHMELTYLTDFGVEHFLHNTEKESRYMQLLQQAVEEALPATATLAKHDIEKQRSRSASETRGAMLGSSCMTRLKFTGLEIDNKLRVQLLKTAGSLQCEVVLSGEFAEQRSEKLTSFSLRLPPFVFWVNFQVINMLLELMPNIKSENSSLPGVSSVKCGVTDAEALNASHLQVSAPPKQKSLGTVHVLDARIIVCFPSGDDASPTDCTLWNQFVALDFSSPILGPGTTKEMMSTVSPRKGLSSKTSRSLHVNFGNVDIYLVGREHNEAINTQDNKTWTFSSKLIVTASSKSGRQSAINMIWQEDYLTSSSIITKAKTLATSGMGNGNKFMGKGYEFASVNAAKDPRKREESSSQARNHFIRSSSMILHLHLTSLVFNLNEESYKQIHRLLKKLKMIVHLPISAKETLPAIQTSLLVQCDSLEILIALDKKENIKKSLQSELPGSWTSLKLNASKFEFLIVSEVGGIRGATFSWVSHCEGKLWGRVSKTSDVDFLLISCSNSSRKRGDGQGSNTLSTSLAGSDIIYLCEPSSSQSMTSITVRCATLIAAGGRLDWFDAIPSFFSLPAEMESAGNDSNLYKVSSFVLNLVDTGLSYEAYKNTVDAFVDFEFVSPCSANIKDEEPYFSCLLAASSVCISNIQASAVIEDSFKIRVQDLGLLLSPISPPQHVDDPYCAEHLRKVGYTKVASEALLEVIVRTNCSSGLLWEVELFESHINFETCNDTTIGLIRLLSQLQQLLTPDVEESVVHLQTRWDSVQHAQANHVISEGRTNSDSEFHPSLSLSASNLTKSAPGLAGWMDEVCDNAYQLEENLTDGVSELKFYLSSSDANSFSQHVPQNKIISEPLSDKGLFYSEGGSSQNFIEDYCISAIQPPTESYHRSYSPEDLIALKSENVGNSSVGIHNGWYMGTSVEFVDDHILESGDSDQLPCELDSLPAQGTVKPKACVRLKNINMRWRMNAGSSWHSSSSSRQTAGISGRDSAVCLEFILSGIGLQYEIFPDTDVLASKLALSVQDFHFYDRSKDAPWKLVLGYYHSKGRPRISSSKAFKLILEVVRPDPAIPLEEYRLSMAFLPILVHLHQSQLDFLTGFFSGISSPADSDTRGISGSKLSIFESQTVGGKTITEEALLPFFQKFEILPVLLRVDYTPRGVDLPALGGGKYAELVNIVPWKGIEIQLKHVHAMGIYGLNSVCDRIVGEWLEDISQNQIHKLLQGLPTIRSLVSVGSGAAKLVTLPLQNYRKDQKLLKGIQRGTIAFLRSISLEAVALGVHLAAGAHDILFQAEYLLSSSSIPTPGSQPEKSKEKDNIRANQPEDAQQGIIQACESLSSGLGEAASALIGTPLKKYHYGASPGSALASAVCATPAAAIAPASAAVRAVHCALLGFRNSLDPEHKKESYEKYLGCSPSSAHHK